VRQLTTETKRVFGNELKVGDTIKVWWSSAQNMRGGKPNEDVITGLRPYTGRIGHLFPKGAQIASFMYLHVGMTIDNGDLYTVIENS
jgi:hypothetical protein